MAKITSYNTEAVLLKRLAAGDASAFDELFYENWDHVFSAAVIMTKSSQLAGDIAQDTFLALWKNRNKADLILNLKGFLHTTAKFLVHKKMRRIRVEDAYRNFLAGQVATDSEYTEQEVILTVKQLQVSLQRGIAQLPPQQQRAFTLSREQGLTHEEISELMGISRKTVKDYIVRAIAFLRLFLRGYLRMLL